ncbi:MAG: hypothetical protein EOP53_15420, partial [Sphingobacteriales bacterium]
NKHKATFFRSNENWQRGREISLEKYDKEYKAEPLIMSEVRYVSTTAKFKEDENGESVSDESEETTEEGNEGNDGY